MRKNVAKFVKSVGIFIVLSLQWAVCQHEGFFLRHRAVMKWLYNVQGWVSADI